ncbi:MAG: GNAT family N-acetyltransferase [Rubrobacteraceae bacterium]|nr:GNAT family N-acetyltransferase [Rubrobacteraceae bacterium]
MPPDEIHLVAPETPLETPRLLLEPLRPDHASMLYEQLQDERLHRFIPQDPPASPQALEDRYGFLLSRRSPDGREAWLNWAVRVRISGDYAGTIEATVHENLEATIAYTVFVPYQRQGFAAEACGRLLGHLFDDYQGGVAAAEIDTRNVASIALVESLGFRRVAFQKDADYFKGSSSDEYRYELGESVWREGHARS